MPHTHHVAVESFWASAVLILAALIYVRGWIRIRRLERDSVGGWRVASFLQGLFFIWLALASPIAALDHDLLTLHMVQHLLLMIIAAPLIWLGVPTKTLQNGLPRRFVETFLAPISRWSPMRRLGNALANPIVCWLTASATLIGWHVPTLFALGLHSDMWHGIEQASFLISGLLFWWPVIAAADRLELVRVVNHPVSIPRHLAVRYPFRISCFLRPRSLPGLFRGTAPGCVFCS